MAGYKGYSMSNNAVSAYAEDLMPISRWTKKAIILQATNNGFSKNHVDQLTKMTLKNLRKDCLIFSEWHHTSKFYNLTNFFELKDEEDIFDFEGKLEREELKELEEEFEYDEGILTYEFKDYGDWNYRAINSTELVKESWGDIDHHHMAIAYLSDDQVKEFIEKHNKKISEEKKG